MLPATHECPTTQLGDTLLSFLVCIRAKSKMDCRQFFEATKQLERNLQPSRPGLLKTLVPHLQASAAVALYATAQWLLLFLQKSYNKKAWRLLGVLEERGYLFPQKRMCVESAIRWQSQTRNQESNPVFQNHPDCPSSRCDLLKQLNQVRPTKQDCIIHNKQLTVDSAGS